MTEVGGALSPRGPGSKSSVTQPSRISWAAEGLSAMHRAALPCAAVAIAAVAIGAVVACDSSGTVVPTDAGTAGDTTSAEAGDAGGGDGGLAVVPPCTDANDSVYADPGDVSAAAKGAILKCAHDQDLTAAALQAVAATSLAGSPAYAGRPFTSGAHIYRVLYRTERGDTANTPGYSSATVYDPYTPIAAQLPVVVASHGSRGQAGPCAPSMLGAAAADVNADFIHLVYPLVGLGYAVIAPDLAGYANFGGANNPPSAYADAADVGKSTLDGVTALRNVLPSAALSQKIALVGHSQGGHTTFSALAMASTYGVSGTIVAAAVYAPLWISQRAWAALFNEPTVYAFSQSAAGVVSLWYHYTHITLLDPPDSGFDIFQPDKLPVVQSFVDTTCWSSAYPALADAGASANDFFTADYVNAMELAATPLGNGDCNGNATCQTWIDRMTADWPHLTGSAAQVPILVWYANGDTTITPDAMQCVFNRLSSDSASYKVCYDTRPIGHSGPPAEDTNYVADWIAQQTLGKPAPTEACASIPDNDAGVPQLTDDAGAPIPCNDLLSNQ